MISRVDMHALTRASEGRSSPKEIAQAALAARLDAVCLTDSRDNTSETTAEVADALMDVGVAPIIGVKCPTREGYLLIYGLRVEAVRFGPYPTMQRVIDAVNAEGGACVVAHPFAAQHAVRYMFRYLQGLCAVEGLNGELAGSYPNLNAMAQQKAMEAHLPMVGGSQARYARDIGRAFTIFDDYVRTPKDLVTALRSGNFTYAQRVD